MMFIEFLLSENKRKIAIRKDQILDIIEFNMKVLDDQYSFLSNCSWSHGEETTYYKKWSQWVKIFLKNGEHHTGLRLASSKNNLLIFIIGKYEDVIEKINDAMK